MKLKKIVILGVTLLQSITFAELKTVTFKPEHVAVGKSEQGTVLYIGKNSTVIGAETGCTNWGRSYFFISLADSRANHFESIALTALSTGKNIQIFYENNSTSGTMQFVGTTKCLIENIRIQD